MYINSFIIYINSFIIYTKHTVEPQYLEYQKKEKFEIKRF